jgi:hypothetical protein
VRDIWLQEGESDKTFEKLHIEYFLTNTVRITKSRNNEMNWGT